MLITVTHISIPAWSTIGHGTGTDEEGKEVRFIGDHRPMRDIGLALLQGEPVEVDLEDWQVTR